MSIMELGTKDIIGEEVYAIATYTGVRLLKIAYSAPEMYKLFPSISYLQSTLGVARYPRGKLQEFCIRCIGKLDKDKLQPARK